MRILLDHNVPAPLRYLLPDHSVQTTFEQGWHELTNGQLLDAAEKAEFDVFITTDQGISYQQNWSNRRLSMVVLSTNDWKWIRLAHEKVICCFGRDWPLTNCKRRDTCGLNRSARLIFD